VSTAKSILLGSASPAGTFESMVGANSQFPSHVRRKRIRARKCTHARMGTSVVQIRHCSCLCSALV